MSADWTPEFFEPFVSDKFYVDRHSAVLPPSRMPPEFHDDGTRDNSPVELVLIEVTRYPRLKEAEGGFDHRPREPFALLFRGPHEDPLVSAVHTVVHDKLGEIQLFLNPVHVSLDCAATEHPDGRFYETPFN